mmetsp:Transcript_208/g.462  ORF Transcript_208/g.462 Transcript_208/m.462 type:complete len:243 (+) Transcript_208:339-1067(+)
MVLDLVVETSSKKGGDRTTPCRGRFYLPLRPIAISPRTQVAGFGLFDVVRDDEQPGQAETAKGDVKAEHVQTRNTVNAERDDQRGQVVQKFADNKLCLFLIRQAQHFDVVHRPLEEGLPVLPLDRPVQQGEGKRGINNLKLVEPLPLLANIESHQRKGRVHIHVLVKHVCVRVVGNVVMVAPDERGTTACQIVAKSPQLVPKRGKGKSAVIGRMLQSKSNPSSSPTKHESTPPGCVARIQIQ